jgi:hypothetical protein
VATLDDLGQHQDAHLRPALADPERRMDALVHEVGRHPHVHDHQVGTLAFQAAQEGAGIGHGEDHVVPFGREQLADALAQQEGVLGDR